MRIAPRSGPSNRAQWSVSCLVRMARSLSVFLGRLMSFVLARSGNLVDVLGVRCFDLGTGLPTMLQEALQLLDEHSPRHARRVRKQIPLILPGSQIAPDVARYEPKYCLLNPERLKSVGRVRLSIILVHEATHGRLQTAYLRRNNRVFSARLESICQSEERRWVGRLVQSGIVPPSYLDDLVRWHDSLRKNQLQPK